MEHSAPVQLAHPWRTATIVASAVAALELVILLVLAGIMIAKPVADGMKTAASERVLAPTKKPKAVAPTVLPRKSTSVLVLNGNGQSGAAAAAAARIHKKGYIIGGVGNAPHTDYARSLVMYRPGNKAEAARLAHDLGIRAVAPLDGISVSELMGAHSVLILGS